MEIIKIDTPWKLNHLEEITELNSVINNEREEQLDIALKLKVLKLCKEVTQEQVESLDWNTITDYMESTNWFWGGSKTVPTIEEMKEVIEKDFLKPALYEIIVRGSNHYHASTGGFCYELYCDPKNPDEENTWCEIRFAIA